MGVERRLLVVVQPDRLRQVLDRLAEDPLLQADVADIDARERIRGLLHQDFLEGAEGVVVVFVQHLRPAQQRLRLRLPGRQLERLRERLNRAGVVAQGNETPALLDERRRTDVIGMEHRPLAGEFRRRGLLGIGGQLLVAIHELADVVLQLGQLGQRSVDLLEKRDDLALGRFPLGVAGRAVELPGDGIVLPPQRRDR